MEKQHKFSIWYILVGIWIVLLMQNYIAHMFVVKAVPYSQFLDLLKDGKVKEIAVSANQIQGKMIEEGGKEQGFKTVRVDPELSDMLQQYNVTFKGEIESTFFTNLLSWAVPFLLVIGIWYFFMRRMSGQQPGFMSLGKN